MRAEPRALRRRLLAHYDAHRRDLPWRHTRDPYAIWVSEVMLQQTRVETVIPYYERFMRAFPRVESLAEASEDDVLAAWSGLGYYRRARLLHRGVKEVVARYQGKVPRDAEARRGLPGVGRYTAGAIGSIAFDRAEPIVDGNVARVLSRIHLIDTPLGRADTERALWSRAEELVEGSRPGDLNQALMEHGATICTPTAPRCDACPVADGCGALATGRVAELPVPRIKKAPKVVRLVSVVATSGCGGGRSVWLIRSGGSLFGGLFGLPTAEGAGDARVVARRALREAGVRARLAADERRVEHALSHRKLTVDVLRATGARAEASESRRLVRLAELGRVGISALTRRCLEAFD